MYNNQQRFKINTIKCIVSIVSLFRIRFTYSLYSNVSIILFVPRVLQAPTFKIVVRVASY